jgi:hypothetical protein
MGIALGDHGSNLVEHGFVGRGGVVMRDLRFPFGSLIETLRTIRGFSLHAFLAMIGDGFRFRPALW